MPEQSTELCIQVLPSPERGRGRGERGEGVNIKKLPSAFFLPAFFIFLWLMENSQMSVLDMLLFFPHSFTQREESIQCAFGKKKKITPNFSFLLLLVACA